MTVLRSVRTKEFAAAIRICCRNYCTTEPYRNESKVIHPYRQIHPWKSENEFANDLLKNVIYNADGIVAINKPYGIPIFNNRQNQHHHHKIVGAVDYCVEETLPYLAKELDVPILIPCSGAEKYMSGVYVFGINDKVCQQINIAKRRTEGKSRKIWAVTIRVPNEIKGKHHVAMKLKTSVLGDKKPIILTQWSRNAVKKNDVKIMNIEFKILTNSTHNLSSLIEIKSSARQWNGIRLFASTMLYSPILGDNIHGSRVQEIMGTWLKVDPFADSCWNLPKINRELLDLLQVTPSQQEIIPVHLHMRGVHLIFGNEKRDIVIEAPLRDPFDWTCKQLKFKIPEMNEIRNPIVDNEQELANM